MRRDQKGRARRSRIAMCRGLWCAVRQPGCDGLGVIRLWLRQGAERAEEDSGDQAGHQNKAHQTRKNEDPMWLAAVASYDHLGP